MHIMPPYRHLCIHLVFSFWFVCLASAQTIFVSPEGSDSNDGRSPKRPVQTLQHAADIAAESSSSIVALPGNYYGAGNSNLASCQPLFAFLPTVSELTTIRLCDSNDKPYGILSFSGSSAFSGFTIQGCNNANVQISRDFVTAPQLAYVAFQNAPIIVSGSSSLQVSFSSCSFSTL